MQSVSQARRIAALRVGARLASAMVVASGLLVLLGWALNIAIVKSFLPGFGTMKPNTAVAFCLAGASLWLWLNHRRIWLSRAAAAAVALIGLVTLLEHALSWNPGFDTILFRSAVALDSTPPGRMPALAAFNFVLLGGTLLTPHSRRRAINVATELAVLVVGLVALLSLVGYVYGAEALYSYGASTAIAFNTTLTFLLLAAAILCARPYLEPMNTAVSDLAGGLLLRRLVPLVMGLIFVLGWLQALVARNSIADPALLTGLFVVLATLALMFLIWRSATLLNRAESARRSASDYLHWQANRLHNLHLIDLDILAATSLDAIANSALKRLSALVPAERLSLVFFEWESATVLVFAAHTRPGMAFKLLGQRLPLDRALTGPLETGRVLRHDDLLLVSAPAPAAFGRLVDEGMRTLVAAPLMARGQLIGAFNLLASRPGAFSQDDIDIAVEVAAQLAIAVQQARASEELQRHASEMEQRVLARTQQLAVANLQLQDELAERRQAQATLGRQNDFLSSLHAITLDVINRRDVDELLQALVRHATDFLNAAYGEILMIDGESFVVRAVTDGQQMRPGDRLDRDTAPLSWQAYESRAPLVVDDYTAWPRRAAILDYAPLQAVAAIPILNEEQCLGVLGLGRIQPGEKFEPDEIQFGGLFAHLAALVLDNAQLRNALHEKSIRDPLTGLFNRRYLAETLEREVQRAARDSRPVSLIMLDIDYFKTINDHYGHHCGDAVLYKVGAYLQESVRAGDIACRYGGEEFALILPGAPLEVARRRAEQFRAGVSRLRLEWEGRPLSAITISLGVAGVPAHGATGEAALRAADAALYRAKQGGRDAVAMADPSAPAAALHQ